MDIHNFPETLMDNSKSSKPSQNNIENNTAQSKACSSTRTRPFYLTFLRIFAGIHLVIGSLAFLVFIFQLLAVINNSSSVYASYLIISFPLTIEGFLVFGIFNAIADIAENMIEVGNYVREIRGQKKS